MFVHVRVHNANAERVGETREILLPALLCRENTNLTKITEKRIY